MNRGIAPEGHRLPEGTRLGPVVLQVADLPRSLDYYRKVLGLRVVDEDRGGATLGAGSEGPPLVILRERRGASPAPAQGRLGLYHFAILLPSRGDLGRFLRHLSEMGERGGASDHAVSEALYLRDPDGLGIEVYADRPRALWQTRGRELHMTTGPLDTQAVLREAGTTPWQRMPDGAVMGHVHLHVADLARAGLFYHQGLGLDKVVWSYPGALFLSAGGYHHHLGLNVWAADARPPGPSDARLLEWTLELPDPGDVVAAAESLETAGYEIDRTADGTIVAADPWGTRLRVRAPNRHGS